MMSHLFFRASPAKTAPALLSRVLVVTGISSVIFGCGSLPMTRVEDASVVELRLLPHTRLLKPGDASRFTVRIENRGSKTLSLDGLALTLEAWKTSAPPTRLESPFFPYDGLDLDLAPGTHANIPLRPERQEFPLDRALPGDYQVRVTANERFTSAPVTVRVLPLRPRRR